MESQKARIPGGGKKKESTKISKKSPGRKNMEKDVQSKHWTGVSNKPKSRSKAK